jgi:hypothetical protein
VSKFIKTKHPKERENKEQKERTHVQARKQKRSTRWQVREVRKSHGVDPTITRSRLKKERGNTLEQTPSLTRTLSSK